MPGQTPAQTPAKTISIQEENDDFRRLELLKRSQTTRHRLQEFFIEGVKSINQARQHGWAIRSLVYAAGGPLSPWAGETLAALPGAKRLELSRPLLERLSDKHETSELIAVAGMRPNTTDRIRLRPEFLVAVVDRPSSPGNLGSIVRSCHALGADALIVTGQGTDVYHPVTVRASMGSLFALPVVRLPSHRELGRWVGAVGAARERRGGVRWIQMVGTSGTADVPVDGVDLERPTVLVFGNEAKGLAAGYRELCDVVVGIPMHGGADSLNVACAAAVMLYEAARQRRQRRTGSGRATDSRRRNRPGTPAAAESVSCDGARP